MSRRSRRQRGNSRQFWGTVLKTGAALGVISALSLYAYAVGQRLSEEKVASLQQEISRLTADHEARLAKNKHLEDELADARRKAEDYRLRMETAAPPVAPEIIEQVRAKLAQGLSAERLGFVISQALPPRNCTSGETRRFMVRTANFDSSNTWVRFNERVTVTALGKAANEGREQWYDPTAEITVTFSPVGGKEQQVNGKLPLRHSMVLKDKEYHFTIIPGARGFVEVTGEWCDFGEP